MNNNTEIRCPICDSNQITADKKGFSGKKAVAGALLTGGIGVLAGTIGSGNVVITCLACGHKFKPGEGKIVSVRSQIDNSSAGQPTEELVDEFSLHVAEILRNGRRFDAIKYCIDERKWTAATASAYVDKLVKEEQAKQHNLAISGMTEFDKQMANLIVNSGLPAAAKHLQELKGISFKEAVLEANTFAKQNNLRAKGACFIATACYGDYDAPEVQILRNYRDLVLARSPVGRWGIRSYYKISPKLANVIAKSEKAKLWLRKYLLAGIVASAQRTIRNNGF